MFGSSRYIFLHFAVSVSKANLFFLFCEIKRKNTLKKILLYNFEFISQFFVCYNLCSMMSLSSESKPFDLIVFLFTVWPIFICSGKITTNTS